MYEAFVSLMAIELSNGLISLIATMLLPQYWSHSLHQLYYQTAFISQITTQSSSVKLLYMVLISQMTTQSSLAKLLYSLCQPNDYTAFARNQPNNHTAFFSQMTKPDQPQLQFSFHYLFTHTTQQNHVTPYTTDHWQDIQCIFE